MIHYDETQFRNLPMVRQEVKLLGGVGFAFSESIHSKVVVLARSFSKGK